MSSIRFGLTILHALLLFAVLDLGFRAFGFQRIYDRMTRGATRRSERKPLRSDARTANRTFAAVQTATRYYYRRRKDCLPRALVTFYLLRRQGVTATLVFGVKKFPFSGHTWVESDDDILDDWPKRTTAYTAIKRVA